MANINGNNMDDLFRQASDRYPLRTDSSDWGRLASALESDPSLIAPQGVEQNDKRRRKRFLWLLLPLLAGGAGYYTWKTSSINKTAVVTTGRGIPVAQASNDPAAVANHKDPVVAGQVRPGTANQAQSGAASQTGHGDANHVDRTVAHLVDRRPANHVDRRLANQADHRAAYQPDAAASRKSDPALSGRSDAVGGAANKPSAAVTDRKEESGGKAAMSLTERAGLPLTAEGGLVPAMGTKNRRAAENTIGNPGRGMNKVSAAGAGAAIAGRGVGDDAMTITGKEAGAAGEVLTAGGPGPLGRGGRTIAGIPSGPEYSKVSGLAPIFWAEPLVWAEIRAKNDGVPIKVPAGGQRPKDGSQSALAKKTTKTAGKHAIYIGLFAAPDLSTIHLQAVRAVGTTYGAMIGYALNSKFSLETGVSLDRKRYFTEGQYFKKENVPALQYVNLKQVNGICNMVEIPVNLRYNLSVGPRYTLFATTGLSTYLMFKEWYAYQGWSSGATTSKSLTYRIPYNYLFSIVNLSIGYEQKLGKIGNLRLEPYLRIPMSGIGTGSLSILSAGLNLGITRRIW
jgi:hypothetical protein